MGVQALPNNGTEVPDEMARTCGGAATVGSCRRGRSTGHLGAGFAIMGGSSSRRILTFIGGVPMEPTLRHVKWPVGPGGVTPPIGPHTHWSDLFGKMLVRAIKRRTISAKRTQHPTLNTQYSILNTQYSTLNTQHSILNTYHSILNTQYSTLNSQHSILNTQRSTSNTQSSTLNTQH